ncbi:MAG TPA: hypothetical protein VEV84_06630 [Pyrinomonadaceae bacterium]|jgi:hypothetical protein|nr:hypothetical protein [Pyrinomonadaceae bacterium]
MAVWLSGVLFLILCHGHTSAASMEYCPLMKLGAHCPKADQDASAKLTNEPEDPGMDCCAFIPVIFDKTRDANDNVQVAVLAPAAVIERAEWIATRLYSPATIFYHSVSLPKTNIFLKNRAIRI